MTTDRPEYQNITIEDVDQALYDHFDRVVDAHVRHPTDDLRKVPVMFASGERWVTGRDQRGIRDKNGVLILPVMSLRRTSIEQNTTMSALGTETEKITVARRVDGKTGIVQNAISSRSLPNRKTDGAVVYEVTTIPFPDRSIAFYELVVQTQYQTQMNEILEKIFANFSLQKSMVFPVRSSKGTIAQPDKDFDERKPMTGYYFVGFAEAAASDSGNLEEFTDTERIVKYKMDIRVPIYLQLDPEGMRPAVQTEKTAFKVGFGDENVCFVDDEYELDLIFTFKKGT